MTCIKRRIERLEEKFVKEKNPIKAIEVRLVGADHEVKSSFIVNIDYGRVER